MKHPVYEAMFIGAITLGAVSLVAGATPLAASTLARFGEDEVAARDVETAVRTTTPETGNSRQIPKETSGLRRMADFINGKRIPTAVSLVRTVAGGAAIGVGVAGLVTQSHAVSYATADSGKGENGSSRSQEGLAIAGGVLIFAIFSGLGAEALTRFFGPQAEEGEEISAGKSNNVNTKKTTNKEARTKRQSNSYENISGENLTKPANESLVLAKNESKNYIL